MSDEKPQTTRVFIGDSLSTSHLGTALSQKSLSTAHLSSALQGLVPALPTTSQAPAPTPAAPPQPVKD